MNPLLEKYLEKKGISDVNELKEDDDPNLNERTTFDNWEAVLSGTEVTVDTISEFCESQITLIENLWENLENTPEKNERLILMHVVYRKFLKLITAAEKKRAEVEAQITALLLT